MKFRILFKDLVTLTVRLNCKIDFGFQIVLWDSYTKKKLFFKLGDILKHLIFPIFLILFVRI